MHEVEHRDATAEARDAPHLVFAQRVGPKIADTLRLEKSKRMFQCLAIKLAAAEASQCIPLSTEVADPSRAKDRQLKVDLKASSSADAEFVHI